MNAVIIIGQAYGADIYGKHTYTCDGVCDPVTDQPHVGVPTGPSVGSPNTGLLATGPVSLIAVSIAGAVLIAIVAAIIKAAIVRRKKVGK